MQTTSCYNNDGFGNSVISTSLMGTSNLSICQHQKCMDTQQTEVAKDKANWTNMNFKKLLNIPVLFLSWSLKWHEAERITTVYCLCSRYLSLQKSMGMVWVKHTKATEDKYHATPISWSLQKLFLRGIWVSQLFF